MLGGFNQTGFNQETELFIHLEGNIESQADIYTKLDNELLLGFNQIGFNNIQINDTELLIVDLPVVFSIASEVEGIGETEVIFSTKFEAEIETITETEGILINVRNLESSIEGIAEVEANLRRIKTEGITFTGEFKAGDKIIFDMEKFTVTLNGQNALHLVEGDFFNLHPGINELVYTDVESNRKVKVKIEYRDRWL